MSYKHLHAVWRHSKSTRAARAVLNIMAARADENGWLYESELTLAAQSGVSDRTIRRVILSLQSAGEIRMIRGPGYHSRQRGKDACNRYQIISPLPDTMSASQGHVCRTPCPLLPDTMSRDSPIDSPMDAISNPQIYGPWKADQETRHAERDMPLSNKPEPNPA